jgi:sugar phosphate permease
MARKDAHNPVNKTFFENAHLAVREILAVVFAFVLDMPIMCLFKHLNFWRRSQGLSDMSIRSLVDYYSFCREVCEVYASNHSKKLGGVGKTIELDETFITKRKYHRGRLADTMTLTVFGIYCREDKEGVYFLVNGKSKRD